MDRVLSKLLQVCYCLIFWVFITVFISQEGYSRQIESGRMDLEGWNFELQGPANLDGFWEFYWNELYDPGAFKETSPPQPDLHIWTPKTWKGVDFNRGTFPGEGFATYRAIVKIDKSRVDQNWSLKILTMSTAYQLWINGELVARNGIVGKGPDSSVPESRPQTATFQPATPEIEIVIQVSNFHHLRGGNGRSLLLGPEKVISKEAFLLQFIDIVFLGAFIIMGVYHVFLFFLWPKGRSSLYFGCFCFLIALRTGLTREHVLVNFYDQWSWSLQFKLAAVPLVLGAPLFLSFIQELFPKLYPKTMLRFVQGVSLSFFVFILASEVSVYATYIKFFQVVILAVMVHLIVVLVIGTLKGEKHCWIALAGCCVLGLSIFNDLLLVNQIVITFYMVPYGFLLFLLIQSFLLARTFSEAFKLKEALSAQLLETEKFQNRVVEEERFRISRELHDQVAQIFSILKQRFISDYKRPDDCIKPDNNCTWLDSFKPEILDLIESGNRTIREVIDDLHPPVLEDLGLAAALRSYVFELNKKMDLAVSYQQLQQIPRGERENELAVFRIVQEALANFMKYAETQKAEIIVGLGANSVWFQVEDEGRGFQFSRYRKVGYQGGRGLIFIRERISQIGGTVHIHSSPGEGTLIFIEIPLAKWHKNT